MTNKLLGLKHGILSVNCIFHHFVTFYITSYVILYMTHVCTATKVKAAYINVMYI